ncbi:hypothetical protein RIB2604_01903480 [Aspergillus luchuensis]|uniref:Uncharacterized protein n=1 Tax=Aspergillus kawachii TaxID=1069201 RepID=A0A146FJD1_ASPKA|nr:hypothetical protein RIB2604_01903480 [Aspergillus luchuensis]
MACARNAMEAAEEGGTVVVDFYHGLNRNGSRGRPSSCSRKDTGSKAGESVIESRIAGLGVHNKGEGGIEEGMRLLGCLLEFRDGQEAQPAGQARGATSSSSARFAVIFHSMESSNNPILSI